MDYDGASPSDSFVTGKIIARVKASYKNGNLTRSLVRHLRMPFRIAPLPEEQHTGSYTTSHYQKGKTYHSQFESEPGRGYIWSLEQSILRNIFTTSNKFFIHLDFAAGTGRISETCRNYVEKQILLDVSDTMLAEAKRRIGDASIYLTTDFRKDESISKSSIEIVTAFRFFPNAENHLRISALHYIHDILVPGGLLICNNHRNFWSPSYFLQRLLMLSGDIGMTNREMVASASKNGFKLVNSYSMGLIPQTEIRSLLPWRLTISLEKFLFERFGRFHNLGVNTIFVFQKQ